MLASNKYGRLVFVMVGCWFSVVGFAFCLYAGYLFSVFKRGCLSKNSFAVLGMRIWPSIDAIIY